MLMERHKQQREVKARTEWRDYLQRRSLIYYDKSTRGQNPNGGPPAAYKPPPHSATAHPRPFLAPTSSALVYTTRSATINPHYSGPDLSSVRSTRSRSVSSSASTSANLNDSAGEGSTHVSFGARTIEGFLRESANESLAQGARVSSGYLSPESPSGARDHPLLRAHSSFALLRSYPAGAGASPFGHSTSAAQKQLPRVGSAIDVGLGEWGKGSGWQLAAGAE